MTDPVSDATEDLGALPYPEALAELETILDRLEHDEPDVDRIAADVARAARLVEHCRGRIVAARSQVAEVVEALDPDVDTDAG
jgi:exodeoxyribonuclease VII small subunit